MVPIYLITGFLESGKTTLIKDSLSDPEFSSDNFKTLIIQFEDGEIEFEEDWLKKYNATVLKIDSIEEFTLDKMKEINQVYEPEQIFIEYNGLNSPSILLESPIIDEWALVQILTTIDSSTFLTYINNIKSYMYEIIKYTTTIIFNRVDSSILKSQLRNNVKVINPEAQIVYINKNNELEVFSEEDLPFNISDEVIDISDEDYGLWYMDAIENIDKYDNHKIILRGKYLERIVGLQHSFILGRFAMVCCADDTQPISISVTGVNVDQMKLNDWYEVEGELKKIQRDDGASTLVLYASKIRVYEKPKYEFVTFA